MVKMERLDLNDQAVAGQFLKLMAESLTARDEKWLKWKYLRNPYSVQAHVFGAVDRGLVLGIRPFLLSRVVVGGKVIPAAQPCDTAVSLDYRGQGLFKAMNDYAVQEMAGQGYGIFFNFPNHNSRPGYLKGGWRDVMLVDESFCFKDLACVVGNKTGSGLISALSVPLGLRWNRAEGALMKLGSVKREGLTIEREEVFSDEFEQLWQDCEPERIRVGRSKAYLHWRFLERPDKEYMIWTARDKDKLRAYLVITLSKRWGSLEGQIVDYQFAEQASFYKLLGKVLEIMFEKQACNFVSIWAHSEPALMKELRKLGFMSRGDFPLKYFTPQRKMIARVVSSAALDANMVYSPGKWAIRSCDQDTY